MALSGLFFGLSSYFSARVNLKNGREQREQQAEFRRQDREDRAAERAQDREDRLAIANRDFDLRNQQLKLSEVQFLLQKQQVEDQAIRYREDVLRSQKNIEDQRATAALVPFIYPSTRGWFLHDPYAKNYTNPGVKSIRVLFQRGKGMSYVEEALNSRIKNYRLQGGGHPVHFLKDVWKETAPSAAWVASELHSWDQSIPTVVLRLNEHKDGALALEGDIFGFPMHGEFFRPSEHFITLPNDPQQIAQAVPLVTLVVADMHFLYTYGKIPLLPGMLMDFIPPGEEPGPVIDELVTAYRQIINGVIEERPDIGIYAALQLAEGLLALPDKKHAIEQIQQIHAVTAERLPQLPELRQCLHNLYTRAGLEQEAANLLEKASSQTRRLLSPTQFPGLDDIT